MEINEYLKENYLVKTKKEMANELNISYYKIEYLLRKLQLVHYTSNTWTEKELNILKEYYPKQTSKEKLLELLPNHRWSSIQKQASKLGYIRKWKHKYISVQGYYVDCSNRKNKKYIHRQIYEQYHNVKLTNNDIVHHIDGNKLNNSINNLVVMTRSEHMKYHWNEITATRIKR